MDALLRIPTCFAVLRQGEGNQMNMQNGALIITYKIKKKKKKVTVEILNSIFRIWVMSFTELPVDPTSLPYSLMLL